MKHQNSFSPEGGDFEKYTEQLVAQSKSKTKNSSAATLDFSQSLASSTSIEESSKDVKEAQNSLIQELHAEENKLKADLLNAAKEDIFSSQKASAAPTSDPLPEATKAYSTTTEEREATEEERLHVAPDPTLDPAPAAQPKKKKPKEGIVSCYDEHVSFPNRRTAKGRRKLDANNDKVQPIYIPLLLMWAMTVLVGFFSVPDGEILPVCMFAAFSFVVSCLLLRSRNKAKQKQQK